MELRTDRPTELVHELTGWAIDAGFVFEDLSVTRPTLEDAYLALVGQDIPETPAVGPSVVRARIVEASTMTVSRLIARQVRYENTAFWRNPAAAFFTFAFPLIFMVLFNLILAGEPGSDTAAQFYTPAIITFSIVNACYTSIAMTVSLARDEGILKRVRGTPLPGWAYLVARMLQAILVAVLLVVIVAVVGRLFFAVELPFGQLPLLLVVLVVSGASFCALGLAMAAIIPNAAAAPAIVNATVLPLYFISNVFVRLDESSVLAQIGDLFPIRHLANALQAVWNPVVHPFEPVDLVWIAAWGALGLVAAVRLFTWEPRS